MPKYTRNTGKSWTPADVSTLKELAAKNTPTRVIGLNSAGRRELSPIKRPRGHQSQTDEPVAV